MDLILCHQMADFDALGAAAGLTRLSVGSRIVLTGGAHPTVGDFLALYRNEFTLIETRSVNPSQIRCLTVVDTQHRHRLGKCANWLDLPTITEIKVYDHHIDIDSDIKATYSQIEPVGATTTLIVELLQQENIQLTAAEATVMALGIHVDTGSLTYEQTTPRDAHALAWLMEQSANVKTIPEYVHPGLSPQLQQLLTFALENLHLMTVSGSTVAAVMLTTDDFVPGLSSLAGRLIDLTESDALLLGHQYIRKGEKRLTIIGRSGIEGTNLHSLFAPWGGGGHPSAAAVSMKTADPDAILHQLLAALKEQIPHPPTAKDLMSSPVRTILPETTIEQAERILFRYAYSGLSIVDKEGKLVGIISRRDLDLALHHGFSHAPVKGYMSRNLKTITPQTPLGEIESLMMTYDVGRLPVLDSGQLVGIVTRTDVLRELYQERRESINKGKEEEKELRSTCLLPSIKNSLDPKLWQLLELATETAQKHGCHLYLVGGATRDLLLAEEEETLLLQDIDLVVDGFHNAEDEGAGVELAQQLQQVYPNARLSVHGAFQTAALLWHKDPDFGSLWVDIATARTEFYPYPAANPEVEASSIRQDLYRRDFTINALALRLTSPRSGELLDFFGGLMDLRSRQIRVLHPNSFIEDPTRIYRAVRFAVRLEMNIESETEAYIHNAISSGVYERYSQVAPALTTRLRTELQYILQSNFWTDAITKLASLKALCCLHPTLVLDQKLWWQIRCISRWLRWIDPDKNLPHWLMRLEVLIAALAPTYRSKVAENLQLPKDSIERLQQLESVERKIRETLPNCRLNSEMATFLRQ
ncbi:MAG: CBS domain-containing protein, partial [Prochloron sp. SP5CPC1]|nr:CBS domain-containing protein [Candidatus Paraprochloron terpiosi SP5CPC1]